MRFFDKCNFEKVSGVTVTGPIKHLLALAGNFFQVLVVVVFILYSLSIFLLPRLFCSLSLNFSVKNCKFSFSVKTFFQDLYLVVVRFYLSWKKFVVESFVRQFTIFEWWKTTKENMIECDFFEHSFSIYVICLCFFKGWNKLKKKYLTQPSKNHETNNGLK